MVGCNDARSKAYADYSCSKVSSARVFCSWARREYTPVEKESGKLTSSFFNGGLIFSTVVMLGIAAISLYCFLLLTKTYLVIPGSFGGELSDLCDPFGS